MVDSTTQTSDDLLESLLMQKLQEAYERRQAELELSKSSADGIRSQVDLDFQRV